MMVRTNKRRGTPLRYNLRPFEGQCMANLAMGKSKPYISQNIIKSIHSAFY